MKRERRVHLFDGAYWETLSFLRTFSFQYSTKKGHGLPKTLYFDSSTHQQGSPEPTAKDLRGHDLLVVDTTCYPLHSQSLANLISLASNLGIPCILVRSHMKLDCLGMEYGRLGSIVVLWNPKHLSASRFASAFMSQLHSISNLMGLPASVSQVYPFLSSKTFQKHNSKWLEVIQNNNKRLVTDLQADPLVSHGPGTPDIILSRAGDNQ